MKKILFLLALLICTSSYANKYFFSSSGDDSRTPDQAKNSSTPWKSISKANAFFSSINTGDTFAFKGGEYFSGKLTISKSGSPGLYIVIESYGTGRAIFQYSGSGSNPGSKSIIYANGRSFIKINNIKFTDETAADIHGDSNPLKTANVGYAMSLSSCNNFIISNNDISFLGIGTDISGNNNVIKYNSFSNLGMVINDASSYNDYGSNGVVLAGDANQIIYNTVTDCYAKSHDYIYDGGAFEIYGAANDNIIMFNTCQNNEGLIEFGSGNSATANNNIVAYNLLINNGRAIYINNSGQFTITVNNLQVYNNTIIENIYQRSKYSYLFTSSTNTNQLLLKNNVFYSTTPVSIIKSTLSGLIHTNNLYNISGNIGFSISGSELNTNPIFTSDYHLQDNSPAINLGASLGYSIDLDSNLISGQPDAGCYEYVLDTTSTDTTTLNKYYQDSDGDTYGNANVSILSAETPEGYVASNTDCNDSNENINPSETEICGDHLDNNCNGSIDEGCQSSIQYVNIYDTTTTERNFYLKIRVSLTAPAAQTCSVKYTTSQGTALAGRDFKSTSGTITFNQGDVNNYISVYIIKRSDKRRFFFVKLSSQNNVIITDNSSEITLK